MARMPLAFIALISLSALSIVYCHNDGGSYNDERVNSTISPNSTTQEPSSSSPSTTSKVTTTTTKPTTTRSTTSKPSTPSTPSSIVEGNHQPVIPRGFGLLTSSELATIQAMCSNDRCVNQTSDAILRREAVKALWVQIIRQSTPYKQNLKLAVSKAETTMRKSYIAKYILMRFFGYPAKKVFPADDGLFEGDVMLSEWATDGIISNALAFSQELKNDAELSSLLSELDRNDVAELDKEADLIAESDISSSKEVSQSDTVEARSAIRVDTLRAVAWASTIYYHFDSSVDKSQAKMVREALMEISNATECLKFVERPVMAEYQLQDTVVFFKLANRSNIQSCVLATLGKQPFNFVYLDFDCPKAKGELLHAMMHVLGVVHEHNRLDRNDYLTIQWSKVNTEFLDYFNLDMPHFISTFGTQFDYSSITMYPTSIAGANAGDQTMIPKNASAGVSMGQRDHLSCGDVLTVKRMFCCPSTCIDQAAFCGYWATKNLCVSKQNWFWLKNNCARACGHCCKIQSPAICSD